VVKLWKDELKKTSEKAAQALADPTEYENLFAGYQDLLKTEQFVAPERRQLQPARTYPHVIVCFYFPLFTTVKLELIRC
jgi:coatomer subunit beta'